MLYFLAIILPPLVVLLCRKPAAFALNLLMGWHEHRWRERWHAHFDDVGRARMAIYETCDGCDATQWRQVGQPPPAPPIKSVPDRIQKGGAP